MELLPCFPIEEVDELSESTPRCKPDEIYRFELSDDDDTQPRSPPTPCSYSPLSDTSSVDCSSISLSTSGSFQHLNLTVYDRLTMDSSRRQETINELENLRHGKDSRYSLCDAKDMKKSFNSKSGSCGSMLDIKQASRIKGKKNSFHGKKKLSYNLDTIDHMLNKAEAAIDASSSVPMKIIKQTADAARHCGFHVRLKKCL